MDKEVNWSKKTDSLPASPTLNGLYVFVVGFANL
jgi:hypothetical protein